MTYGVLLTPVFVARDHMPEFTSWSLVATLREQHALLGGYECASS
jgi:hypothetical protein